MKSSLALVEMKTLLREIYSKFRTSISSEMMGSMEMDDQTIACRPRDQVCLLVFDPVGV